MLEDVLQKRIGENVLLTFALGVLLLAGLLPAGGTSKVSDSLDYRALNGMILASGLTAHTNDTMVSIASNLFTTS